MRFRGAAGAAVLLLLALVPLPPAGGEPTEQALLHMHARAGTVAGRSADFVMDREAPTGAVDARVELTPVPVEWLLVPAVGRTTDVTGDLVLAVYLTSDLTVFKEITVTALVARPDGIDVEIGRNVSTIPVYSSLAGDPPALMNFTIEDANETIPVGGTLALRVRAAEEGGTGTVELLFDSTEHDGVLTVDLTERETGAPGLTAAEPQREAMPGDEVRFSVMLLNRAPVADNLTLAVLGPDAWGATVSPTNASLAANESLSAVVTARAPADAREGDEAVLTLVATSAFGAEASVNLTVRVKLPPPPEPDTDGDGSDDGAERACGSNPSDAFSTPDTDDDGDGATNCAETRAGTDPKDPASRPGGLPPPPPEPTALDEFRQDFKEALPASVRGASDALLVILILLGVLLLWLIVALLRRKPFRVRFDETRREAKQGEPVHWPVTFVSRSGRDQVVACMLLPPDEPVPARLAPAKVRVPARGETQALLVVRSTRDTLPGDRTFEVRATSSLAPRTVATAKARLRILAAPAAGAPPVMRVPTEVRDAFDRPKSAGPRVVIRDVRHAPPHVSLGEPVRTHVVVTNLSDAAATGVPVRLVLDGVVTAEERVDVPAGATKEVLLDWVPKGDEVDLKVRLGEDTG